MSLGSRPLEMREPKVDKSAEADPRSEALALRVTLVTNIPAPYRIPLYDEVDRLLRADSGRFTVIYGARTASDRQWSNAVDTGRSEASFVPRGQFQFRKHITYINPTVVVPLSKSRPHVVIAGGYAPWTYAVAAWCRANRVPLLLWSGETTESARAFGYRRVRRRPLVSAANGGLAYGPGARDYLVEMGMAPERITVVGNGIDVPAFAGAVDARRHDRSSIRNQLGLRGRTILSVGGKGLELAAAALDHLGDSAVLAVAGRDEVPTIDRRVVDLGRRPASAMPDIYAAGDCLVHTPVSPERWSHAINEALSAGLPVVASGPTGVPDQILSGPGCRVVANARANELGPALEGALGVHASENPDIRAQIRAALMPWDVRPMAARIVSACFTAVAGR